MSKGLKPPKTVRLRGTSETQDLQTTPKVDARHLKLKPKGRVRLGAARDAGGVVELPGMEQDDLACVEYSNGFKLWIRVDDLHQAHAAKGGHSRSARGEVLVDADVWEIDPQVPGSAAERGVVGLAIEALEFFGVDLKEMAAEKLAQWLEHKKIGREAGLYHCVLDEGFKLTPAGKLPAKATSDDPPLLVFIHGTASNTEGSFGALWSDNNTSARQLRARLAADYRSGVFAYEHRSLTQSPIDNALELAAALPEGAALHLVSHSRGGLVGELLCLGQRGLDKDPLNPTMLDNLFAEDRTQGNLFGFGRRDDAEVAQAYAAERGKLEKLLTLLEKKRLRVTRFVRVACPARGTTLASGRLDRWLSVLGWLSPEILDDGLDFLLGVVKQRTDPRTLPGLEAMMPGSALISLLNLQDLQVDADLSVIAGDIQGETLWSKMKWILADWFYAGDHDLVVNTGSMYGGAQRPVQGARYFFDQGKEVNHFRYFTNEKTVNALLSGLTRTEGALAGFKPLAAARLEKPEWHEAVARSATGTPRPLVFLLPGTMGSQLKRGGDRIWLSYWDLARGKLADLGIEAPGVTPLDLLDDYYGELMQYLARSHRVEPFPYDWRLSVLESADLLAQRVAELLPWCERNRQPMRFLAHSMGGLVARAMIARRPDLWERVQKLEGSRLIMLGTPNAGSYEAVRWLTGFNPTEDKITLLDCLHGRDGIIGIVCRYPGLLELLPARAGARDFSKRKLWDDLKTELEESWPLPESADLIRLSTTWKVIAGSPVDTQRMVYVAGWAPHTVCDYQVKEEWTFWDPEQKRKVLRFYANKKGDGTVPWDLGLLPEVQTWYVEQAAHDELPNCQAAFPAYLELLQTGSTVRLPVSPPSISRSAAGEEELFAVPLQAGDSLAGEADLSGFVFGASFAAAAGRQRRLPRVKLSVRHGDLAYARYPVCVGHYQGDSIVSAEAALDRRLNGALIRRARLGLYPGPLGTQQVFINPDPRSKPGGTLVIGLGRVGELTPGALESGMARAALEYALTVANWGDDRFGSGKAVRSARLSCLLIGSGAGGMDVNDSLRAILRGVKSANDRLMETGLDDKVLLDELEFLELYQDTAIQAARDLHLVLADGDLADSFDWPECTVQDGQGGRRRVLFEEAPYWWQRLEIIHDRERDELRFVALTDKARAEESLVAGQIRLAEDFVREAEASTGEDEEVARTLFEMLLPNQFKEMAPDQNDLVLVVDDLSARFPWEMLQDGWSVNGRPLSVAAGMLRQLKTPVYRAHPSRSHARMAYVVGNPKLPPQTGSMQFPDLPGAAKEAQEVAALLSQAGFEVTERIGSRARDILIALHGNAYRILHLAGHGVHEMEVKHTQSAQPAGSAGSPTSPEIKRRVSGMVIGEGVYLTPGDVEQMRWVPELVFINCCHLGSTTSSDPAWSRYSALAANLATEFINMGVKAVVAAGWAVDDAAARRFANCFYDRMLKGEGFGKAVLAARGDVYEHFPGVNTWGAYQCYGDPDFRLNHHRGGSGWEATPYHAPAEVVADLENMTSNIRMAWKENISVAEQQARVEALLARIPPSQREKWLARADVNTALGLAYGEMADVDSGMRQGDTSLLDQAIDALSAGIAAKRAEIPVRAVEQRANFRVKRALQRWLLEADKVRDRTRRNGAKPKDTGWSRDLEQAIHDLSALIDMAGTAERYALLGSAYKRQAWMQTKPAEMKDALTRMADNYRLALDPDDRNQPAPYPLTNWLTAEAMLNWFKVKHGDDAYRGRIPGWIDQAVNDAVARQQTDPDFWNSVVEPDCRLALALAQDQLEEPTIADTAAGYRRAMEQGSSPKERSSVLEQLDFLADMAQRSGRKEIAKAVGEIRRQLV